MFAHFSKRTSLGLNSQSFIFLLLHLRTSIADKILYHFCGITLLTEICFPCFLLAIVSLFEVPSEYMFFFWLPKLIETED